MMKTKYVWDEWEDWDDIYFGRKKKITPKAVNWTSTNILQKIRDEYVIKGEDEVLLEEDEEARKKHKEIKDLREGWDKDWKDFFSDLGDDE